MRVVESHVRPDEAQHPKVTVCSEQSPPEGIQVKPELDEVVLVAAAEVVVVTMVVKDDVVVPSTGVESTGTQVRVVESHVRPDEAQHPNVAVCSEQSPPEGIQVKPELDEVVAALEVDVAEVGMVAAEVVVVIVVVVAVVAVVVVVVVIVVVRTDRVVRLLMAVLVLLVLMVATAILVLEAIVVPFVLLVDLRESEVEVVQGHIYSVSVTQTTGWS